jgi:ABC-type amino acid transport substrate-binding protein
MVDENGAPTGIGPDLLRFLGQRLGIVLEPDPDSLDANLSKVRNGALPALMDVTPNAEREEFLLFTQPYLVIPHVIVARSGETYFHNEDDLGGRTVALEKSFGNVGFFREKYPTVAIVEYPDTASCLVAVSTGEADAYAGNRAVATHLIARELLPNLQVQGRLRKPGSVLTIGVRRDWPELAGAMDKALAGMTEQDMNEIVSPWVGLRQESASPGGLDLTEAERRWLRGRQKIRVNGGAWPPLIMRGADGRHSGIAVDILEDAAALAGIGIEYVEGSWPTMIDMLSSGELDLLQCVSLTEQRTETLRFTSPYLNPTDTIFVRRDSGDIASLDDLKGRTLVCRRGGPYRMVKKRTRDRTAHGSLARGRPQTGGPGGGCGLHRYPDRRAIRDPAKPHPGRQDRLLSGPSAPRPAPGGAPRHGASGVHHGQGPVLGDRSQKAADHVKVSRPGSSARP